MFVALSHSVLEQFVMQHTASNPSDSEPAFEGFLEDSGVHEKHNSRGPCSIGFLLTALLLSTFFRRDTIRSAEIRAQSQRTIKEGLPEV